MLYSFWVESFIVNEDGDTLSHGREWHAEDISHVLEQIDNAKDFADETIISIVRSEPW